MSDSGTVGCVYCNAVFPNSEEGKKHTWDACAENLKEQVRTLEANLRAYSESLAFAEKDYDELEYRHSRKVLRLRGQRKQVRGLQKAVSNRDLKISLLHKNYTTQLRILSERLQYEEKRSWLDRLLGRVSGGKR